MPPESVRRFKQNRSCVSRRRKSATPEPGQEPRLLKQPVSEHLLNACLPDLFDRRGVSSDCSQDLQERVLGSTAIFPQRGQGHSTCAPRDRHLITGRSKAAAAFRQAPHMQQ
jgi:hypothetical protein